MDIHPAPSPDPTTASVPPPDGSEPVVVEVRDLRCRYGDFEAVRGLDLTVHRGELFALLGTNGAGKTTTLETLEGHRRPSGGEVRILGHDPFTDRRAIASRVGVVLQEAGLPGALTASEAIRTWGRLHPHASPGDLVRGLDRVGLSHRRDVRVEQLSGGEKRRLDLALALATGPELLFLDEPTTGMDPEARVRTWEIVRELRRSGTTIVLTTHYLEEAEALADRLAIMHAGRIVASGTLASIVDPHPSSIVALLPRSVDIDTSTMPDLRGTVRFADVAGGRRLAVETHQLQRDLTALMGWADAHGHELRELSASHASLTQVFGELAGDDDGSSRPRELDPIAPTTSTAPTADRTDATQEVR